MSATGQNPAPAASAPIPLSMRIRQMLSSQFVAHVAQVYATQITVIVLGVITTMAVARLLGPEGRGLYAVAVAIGSIGIQFLNLGLHASNTYFVAKDRALLPKLLANSLLLSAIGGVVLIVVGEAVLTLFPNVAPLHGSLLFLSLLWIPVGLAYLLMQNLLIGIGKVGTFNKTELFNRITSLALLGVLLWTGKVEALVVFSIMLFALFCSDLILWKGLKAEIAGAVGGSMQVFRENLGIGIKAYLICLFGYLLLRFDLLMVKQMRGAAEAGYYSIATAMADYILLLPTSIATILFPKLSGTISGSDRFKFGMKATAGAAAILLPIVLVAGVLAAPAIRILFGRAFLPSATAFILLLPGIYCMGIQTVLVQFLNSQGYPKSVVYSWLAALVLNLGLNVLWIPQYGMKGASVASSICYFLVLVSIGVCSILNRRKLA